MEKLISYNIQYKYVSFSRWVIGGFLILLTGSIAYFNYFIKYDPTLLNVLYSVIILLVAYIVNILLDNFIKKQVPDAKERYTIKKVITTFISIISFGVLLAVWIKETTTLVMAYGLLSAGVAIALQDLLKNVAGGVIIAFMGEFKPGDRIQVEKETGDVLDINFFYTTLMEIQEWVDGDQYTGRLIQIPNGFILNKTVKNYTKDFSFIWDEIYLMLTYDSNWKKGMEIATKIVHETVVPFEATAKNELVKMGGKYFIDQSDVEEKAYLKITDNWIDLRLRYVVDPRKRRFIKHTMHQRILEAFENEKDVKLASVTIDIVGFPPVRTEKS